MSRAQAESVIKNIIREIAQECASKGQAVSETLVAFMVSANVNRVDVNASVMMYPGNSQLICIYTFWPY